MRPSRIGTTKTNSLPADALSCQAQSERIRPIIVVLISAVAQWTAETLRIVPQG
jgi:hypothetical protein